MSAIGIDFGTTNSVVAVHAGGTTDVLPIDSPPLEWANLGFDRVLPSVLGHSTDGDATFGWEAKYQGENRLEAVKRLFATEDTVRIGNADYSVELAASLLFARLRKGSQDAGVDFDRAVVTIPANSRGLARFRTKLCAGLAGIDVAALLNEPTAAAMAHSINAKEDQNILVFDWGGGTLDVTVLETVAGVFIERASKGIQRSGGLDLDNLFAAAVLPRFAGSDRWDGAQRADFRRRIEYAKVQLSTQRETAINLAGGETESVTRQELEDAIALKIQETRQPIDQCLKDLGIDAKGIDQVVLVGGSCKIPAVRAFVSEVLGQAPVEGTDPMTAVAEGAAAASAILSGELDADFFVATEHALGTISVDERGILGFSELIGRNHNLPAKAQGGYRPANAKQKQVTVRVIEGDPAEPIDHPDNVVLKEWDVDLIEGRSQDDSAFTMTYEYDVDGILHVTVTDDQTGEVMLKDDLSFGISRDKGQLVELAKSVRETMDGGKLRPGEGVAAPVSTALDQLAVELLTRVRSKIIPFVDDEEGQRLEAVCIDLENADGGAVDSCKHVLEAEARKYAYLL